jgi:hypothetical protein
MMHVLIEGLIYALVLALIVTLSQFYNPRLWLNCYPSAIQKVVPVRTKKEMKEKLLVGVPFMVIMVGYPIYSTLMLKIYLGSEYNFWIGFFNLITIQNIFNLFDLLILDWLVFSTIKPRYLILEGTEGMKDYGNYYFHFNAALKGFFLSLILSAIVAIMTVQ